MAEGFSLLVTVGSENIISARSYRIVGLFWNNWEINMRGIQRLLSKNIDTFKVGVIEFKMILKLIFIFF